jgi:hypothetical protein
MWITQEVNTLTVVLQRNGLYQNNSVTERERERERETEHQFQKQV